MNASDSISAVPATVRGQSFNLLGDLVAFNAIERHYNKPWFAALDHVRASQRIDDVAVLFAAFARSGGAGDTFTTEAAMVAMKDMSGYAEALKAVQMCIDAAMPPKNTDNAGEAGDGATTPP